MTKPNYVKRKEKEVLQVWDPLKKCLKLWLTCNLTVSNAEEYKNTSLRVHVPLQVHVYASNPIFQRKKVGFKVFLAEKRVSLSVKNFFIAKYQFSVEKEQ